VETCLLIAGEAVAGDGTPLDVEAPSTGAVLATLATASADQLDAALRGAREAQPRWGLEAFMETKHVHIESVLEAKDWWYPYGA
jgi:aminobutyraldehyde dehydrogenase